VSAVFREIQKNWFRLSISQIVIEW
jgi:hypothetical protein